MIKRIIQKIKNLLYHEPLSFVSIKADSDRWVCVSYIADVFYLISDEKYMSSHQNKRESIYIVDIFNKLGYNVYVISNNSKKLPPINIKFDIIFGIDPKFVELCERYPNAKKIYYATGAYFEHQNSIIKKRTDEFNERYNCSLPYRRIVLPHISNELADVIIQIGSDFTKSTYPKHLQSKIDLIKQSSYAFKENFYRTHYNLSKEYIWFGSSGNILKGVDIVIEYFINHTELILHIVGPLEDDFIKIFKNKITSNIHLYGFMLIDSRELIELTQRCNFVIYPSGSEGGIPGAILNMMKLGVIPIVSKWAAFNEILDFGYLLEDLSVSAIDDAIVWSRTLNENSIRKMSNAAIHYVLENHNQEYFKIEFERLIKKYAL